MTFSDKSEPVTRRQWRMWLRNGSDEMMGLQWRSHKPDAEEVAEWREDFVPDAVSVQTRIVVEHPAEHVSEFDVPASRTEAGS